MKSVVLALSLSPTWVAPLLPVLPPAALGSQSPAPAPLITPSLALLLPAARPLALPTPTVICVPFAIPAAADASPRAALQSTAKAVAAGKTPFLDALFDSRAARSGAVETASVVGLAPENAHAAGRVEAVVDTLRGSAAGRRILAKATRILAGRPLPIEVRDLGKNLGEYDYIAGVLRIDRKVMSGDPRDAAATLAHELVHIIQHQEGVPAEALELELEAHILTFDVMRELGLDPRSNSFSKGALDALQKGPRAYVDWMAGQLAGKPHLVYGSLSDVSERFSSDVEDLAEKAEEATGKREQALSARLWWAQRDLDLVRSKKGKAAYRAMAARVLRLMRAAHKRSLQPNPPGSGTPRRMETSSKSVRGSSSAGREAQGGAAATMPSASIRT